MLASNAEISVARNPAMIEKVTTVDDSQRHLKRLLNLNFEKFIAELLFRSSESSSC